MTILKAPVKMNPAVKVEWLAALRGGEYEQGTGVLHTEDGKFCCLGVLCDLAVKAKVLAAPTSGVPTSIFGKTLDRNQAVVNAYLYPDYGGAGDQPQTASLPLVVAQWAGVPAFGERFSATRAIPDTLAELNDAGVSFAQIADIIEAEY